jgi:hypothetical protein
MNIKTKKEYYYETQYNSLNLKKLDLITKYEF